MLKTFILLFFLSSCAIYVHGQSISSDTIPQDTLNITELPIDSSKIALQDSLHQELLDSLKRSSDLKSRVNYQARDSIIFDIEGKQLLLYGEVKIIYDDIILAAERVKIDWAASTMYAQGIEDSTGQIIGQPVFEEGGQKYNADRITFNFNTRKGKIIGGRTQQLSLIHI